jgi:release factor glutamine methyltransferase
MSVTAADALRWGAAFLQSRQIDSARLDAEVLVGFCLQRERPALYSDPHYRLTPGEQRCLARLIARRGTHEPLAYLTGVREFWSLPLGVQPGVLIPRPETEWVVETALRYIPALLRQRRRCRVLDIGTGSGNIAIAVAASQAAAEVTAVDISPAALITAQRNARACQVGERVTYLGGDLFAPLNPHRARFDLLLSNPPYIATAQLPFLPITVRNYEPRLALDGGNDGLRFYRCLAAEGPQYLRDHGFMIVEVGYDQAEDVSSLLVQSQHWELLEIVKDYSGIERVVVAQYRRKHRLRGAARHGLHRDRRWSPAAWACAGERGEECRPADHGEFVANGGGNAPT